MESLVSITQVSKNFGKRQILNQVSIAIDKGQIYGLIGPSGAGKTTLVKMIVGMEKVDQGNVMVMGRKMPDVAMLQNIGYMAQADALYEELTGEENLLFFAALFQLNKKQQKERIAYVAELVDLKQELHKKVCHYSGGMKRRLSLAVALIQDPALLILDEPTVGIDPELRVGIWKELYRLKEEEGKTIIVTTHVMDEAARCDILAMVRDGVVLVKGTPKELLGKYDAQNLEEVFLRAGGKSI